MMTMTAAQSRLLSIALTSIILLIIPYARSIERFFKGLASIELALLGIAVVSILAGLILKFYRGLSRLGYSPRFCAGHAVLCILLTVLLGNVCLYAIEFAHIVTYGLLAVLLLYSMPPSWGVVQAVVVTLFSANCISFVDELIQGITPERVFDPRDLLINFLGSVLGIIAGLPKHIGSTRLSTE